MRVMFLYLIFVLFFCLFFFSRNNIIGLMRREEDTEVESLHMELKAVFSYNSVKVIPLYLDIYPHVNARALDYRNRTCINTS